MKFILNGKPVDLVGDEIDPAMPLLWAIRDHAGLTGTKYGCGMGLCGACTVLIDGAAARACSTPLSAVAGRHVTTIEGLEGKVAEAVKAAWERHDVAQCGYCQPGQVVAAAALLAKNRRPSDEDIDEALDGNVCRCATYVRIRAAIHDAAKTLA